MQGLGCSRRTWVFAVLKVGALEGCGQRTGQALTQMLTSTLWCLLRGGGAGVGVQLGLSRCGRLVTGKVCW